MTVMKRIAMLLAFVLCSLAAPAQTPQEIISKMEDAMAAHQKEGLVMTVDTKVPILGTMSAKTYNLGEKVRAEVSMMGATIITWNDADTQWMYNSKDNTVEIKASPVSKSSDADASMFQHVAEGYDVTLKKETAEAWYLQCKKSHDNPDKDAPKHQELIIAKGSYLPLSLKASGSGVTLTIHEISFGVSESQVTFNPAEFPDAKVLDKR